MSNNKQTAEESFYEQIDQTNPVTRGSTALVKISKLTSAQTAVEWLIEQLTPSISLQQKHIDELLDRAKEMEKQQMMDAHNNGYIDGGNNKCTSAEQYYNERYGE